MTATPQQQAPPARRRIVHRGVVLRREQLTPCMVRVVFGGDGLDEFDTGDWTDSYVKLLFPQPGVDYPRPLDMAVIERDLPRELWPVMRTYTVRWWDRRARELAIDFVVHGDEGIAGPWAAGVEPGDELLFRGPGGAYAPDPDADWHLLAGDESALPAIAAALERLPTGARATALIEIADDAERQPVPSGDGVQVRWLTRGSSGVGAPLVEAIKDADLPIGDGQLFVHGEAGFVRELRRILRVERGVPRARLSISGYWRLGHNEDGWQASKREWNAAIEAEQETPVAG